MTVVASNYVRQENDLYQTEPWATEALLKYFPVEGMIVWEPCAGNHLMVDVLKDNNAAQVWSSDIKEYNFKHDFHFDFLNGIYGGLNIDAIISNPPYGKGNREAVKFVELALERCDNFVAALLTAKFDFGKTRLHLTKNNKRFLGKVNLIDRIQWFPGATTGTEDHAWYVWGKENQYEYPRLMYHGK